jgi:hypothetical protein
LISQNIIFYCSFYKENNNNNKRNTQREDKWEAPGEGLLMINTDGATFAGERGAGLGVVIRDQEGSFIAGLSCRTPGSYSAEVAEALAITQGGLSVGKRFGVALSDSRK